MRVSLKDASSFLTRVKSRFDPSTRGVGHLLAAPVIAMDLWVSDSLILLGLVAEEGLTEVNRIYHLDRDYEALEKKFQNLGARVCREND